MLTILFQTLYKECMVLSQADFSKGGLLHLLALQMKLKKKYSGSKQEV